MHPQCSRSLAGTLLVACSALPLALLQAPARAQDLYRLTTTCSLAGAAPVPCTIEAKEEGDTTVYRHTIGRRTESVRISDQPVRMSIWRSASRSWEPVRNAAARFSTNTICFNGVELCAVNPNYLNSVREDRAGTGLEGRDLVMVHFGSDGRVDASCYDDACRLIRQ
ncbi:MAG: hypothetical protein VKI81_02945 [Synechococcaceae cyanobacterium]|nr:hypothetical protein [Synechococcaceae cyanobacterium]